MMKVKMFRYNPEVQSEPWYDSFDVPLASDGTYTAMDVLDYIYENLDGTVAYYRHSVCNQGICGRCAVKIDGKVSLACTCRIRKEEICIEPKNNNNFKDLVVL